MPSNLPSSFASAAAGQNASRDPRGRGDGRGNIGGDWSRRDGRSANGTLTFRRSSTTPIGHSSQAPPPIDHAVQPLGVDIPTPTAHSQPYEAGPARYTKDDLLDMFHPQKGTDSTSRLFISGWNPSHVNGNQGRGWGKSNDNHVPQEPGACWDETGDTIPMGLQEFSMEEKEAFSTEINSPLKPPTQNKDGHTGTINGRKASISHGATGNYGLSSPVSATRPGTRRRETVESNPFSSALNSPTATRFAREDPSYWFPRKGGDAKEAESEDQDQEHATREMGKNPFGNLIRHQSTGSPMGSMWPQSSSQATTPIGGPAGGFGNFALPSASAPGDKRAVGAAGGSRLAHLIPKDAPEAAPKPGEMPNPLNQSGRRSRPRTDTDPFGDDTLSGSAVLGGAQDTTSVGPAQASRVAPLGTPIKGSTGDFGMSGLNIGSQADDDGPLSPSETNPYRSPPAERHEHDEAQPHAAEKPLGVGHLDHPNINAINRGFGAVGFEGSDRSQTSSVGAKGYPLGAMSGWPAPGGPSVGTPDRERPNFGNAFGSSLFNPMGEIQSPGGLGNLNNVFGPASAGGLGTGSIGRGSKLGSLFPPAMQAQMQSHEHEKSLSDSLPDLRQSNPLGAIGRSNFTVPVRDTDSPIRSNRGVFEELFPSSDASRSQGVFSGAEAGAPLSAVAGPGSFTPVTGGLPFGGSQAGGEPPSAQVRQMVMPDRMRWVYLDPQGQVQGPFTGLEMNDWYKAHFFTPDLRVKKVEDPEFEPLGQLIRRIGNSREPFLVPQIGIAHGPPTQGGPFTPSTGNGIIPPLSGVFPSFGRTLTAEEQNNLERRKQEEQFLMAQQREFMMRQQALSKFQMQGPGLQHHSSAHSLQSQPSFGSITSPIGMSQQQSGQQSLGAVGPSSGFFEQSAAGQAGTRAGPGNGELFRDEDLAQLANERQVLAALQTATSESAANQPIGALGEMSLRSGLPETEQLGEDSEGFRERLMQFEDLRAQHEAEQAAAQALIEAQELLDSATTEESPASVTEGPEQAEPTTVPSKTGKRGQKKQSEEALLSLTQQVQKTQAAAAAAAEPQEPGMPMPFPPPTSSTPLPAPTAQRVRSNLPEQYSRSQSGTPDTNASAAAQPPPLAPWAKDPGHESQKGPSLKEIQEAEARKAAKAEELAAAMRKAAMEQEAAAMREKEKVAAAAAAAGLPASSTWGHGSPVSTTTPWAKPAAPKGPAPGLVSAAATAASKKTLAEIQREEELRKQKTKEVSSPGGAPVNVSKSYANLAGKPNQPASPMAMPAAAPAGSGWATVGAGGKVKGSTGTAPSPSRSASATIIKPVTTIGKPASKPTSILGGANGKSDTGHVALDEFNKWVGRELSRGITGVDVASFQSALEVLPLDTGIISDAVYANSTTMDGRHFAEEYVRRKKLAEKGVVERQSSVDEKGSSSSGGWSEVAKKGGSTLPKEPEMGMQGAGFKVVPSRKKGKK